MGFGGMESIAFETTISSALRVDQYDQMSKCKTYQDAGQHNNENTDEVFAYFSIDKRHIAAWSHFVPLMFIFTMNSCDL